MGVATVVAQPERAARPSLPLAAVLRAVATPELHVHNSFRVTGLRVDASPRDVSRCVERMRLEERLGSAPASRGDAVREAVQRLQDPERRLVDELFAPWPLVAGGDDLALAALARGDSAAAVASWREEETSPQHGAVAAHNLALHHHEAALAIDLTAEASRSDGPGSADEHWRQAFLRFARIAQDDAFWSRVAARVRELDDPRLGPRAVDGLREGLPLALLAINAQLAVRAEERASGPLESSPARRQVALMAASGLGAEAQGQALEAAADPLRQRLKTLAASAEAEADAKPGEADRAAARLLEQSRGPLRTLDALLAPDHPIRVAAHDDVALRVLGCQIAFGNATRKWSAVRATLAPSLALAASESTRARMRENLAIVEANLLADTCFFCKTRPAESAHAIPVALHGEVQRNATWQGTRITWSKSEIPVPRCAGCAQRHAQIADPAWLGWVLLAACLSPIAVAVGLYVFVPRWRKEPSAAIGRYLGLLVWLCGQFLLTLTLALVQAAGLPGSPLLAGVGLLSMLVVMPLLVWQGGRLGARRAAARPGRPKVEGLPLNAKHDYPPIKERLDRGWSLGAEPTT